MNKDEFITKAKVVHCDENLDYSQVEYKNNRTKVKIIDPIYGEFWQTPSNHLKGQSHPLRRRNKISIKKRSKQNEIIRRFKEVHKNENLDYSQVNYVNMHTKVKIISHDLKPDGTEYGEFWQEPAVHLKGCTHPLLGKRLSVLAKTDEQDEFIRKAKIVHSDANYGYEMVDYVNNHTKIDIICHCCNKRKEEHGLFSILPHNLLRGKGCPKCGNHLSYAEDEIIQFIGSFIGEDKIIKNDRNVLDGKELDIYIPSLKIGIEYNGNRWHSELFGKDKYYHLNKLIACNQKGIKLISIFEDEYVYHKNIVLSKIKYLLNLDNNSLRIYARKCFVKEINRNIAKKFLEENHIQGYTNSTIHLGAFYKNALISVMSFRKEIKNKNKWELTRFATQNSYICCGIGGKLFKYFIRNYNPDEVKSFADRRWTVDANDNLYIKIGFHIDKIENPDYKYYNPKLDTYKRFHKFGFRKCILNKKYGFPLTMTENEMTKELGCVKIWDCGLIKYVWNKLI